MIFYDLREVTRNMEYTFECPFTGQEIIGTNINQSNEDGIIIRYYLVKIGDKKRYIKLCESFFDLVFGKDAFIKTEINSIKPIILHELVNDKLHKLGGHIFHWDCQNAKNKPGHILLKGLIQKLKMDSSYPITIKQKTDNLLLYLGDKQKQQGEALLINDDIKTWGNLFFSNFDEMKFYLKELEEKKILSFNENKNTVKLKFDGLDHLEKIKNQTNKIENGYNNESEFLSESEIENINTKIDEVLQKLKEMGLGHEIIYDEIQDLKNQTKNQDKKTLRQIVLGKLGEISISEAGDRLQTF